MAIRVAIADDSLIIRQGIHQILAASTQIQVVATCGDYASLLAAVQQTVPDVVLTDIRMPPTHTNEGIRLAAGLRESHPEIGVIVLSQYSEPGYVVSLFDSGSEGRGYLLKDRIHNRLELVEAIDSVAHGGSRIDPKIVEVLVNERTRDDRSPLRDLTAREREVLAEIATGRSNQAIAETLVLTKRAIEKHINSIFLKLDLSEDSEDVSRRVMAAVMFLAESPSRGA